MEAPPPLRAPGPLGAKGDAGRPLIVAGSRRYHGAAVLCATAALRSGADYAYVLTRGGQKPVISSYSPDIICMEYADPSAGAPAAGPGGEPAGAGGAGGPGEAPGDQDWTRLRISSVVMGPGLGRDAGAERLFAAVASHVLGLGGRAPLVLDADGLWCFARLWAADRGRALALAGSTTVVLTPNAREFAMLCEAVLGEEGGRGDSCAAAPGLPGAAVEGGAVVLPRAALSRLREGAERLAGATGCVVLLKGLVDVAAWPGGPAGQGNPGGPPPASLPAATPASSAVSLAPGQPKRCAGQGDVLAGALGALLGLLAATGGPVGHEAAGRLALAAGEAVRRAAREAHRVRGLGLCASDLAGFLPAAIAGLFPGLTGREYEVVVR